MAVLIHKAAIRRYATAAVGMRISGNFEMRMRGGIDANPQSGKATTNEEYRGPISPDRRSDQH